MLNMFEDTMVIKVEKCLIPSQDSGEFHSSLYSFMLKQQQLSPAGPVVGFVTSETSRGGPLFSFLRQQCEKTEQSHDKGYLFIFSPKNNSAPDSL